MTALMGIPVLGEWPPVIDWIAIVAICIGVYAVGGGPLPRLRRSLVSVRCSPKLGLEVERVAHVREVPKADAAHGLRRSVR